MTNVMRSKYPLNSQKSIESSLLNNKWNVSIPCSMCNDVIEISTQRIRINCSLIESIEKALENYNWLSFYNIRQNYAICPVCLEDLKHELKQQFDKFLKHNQSILFKIFNIENGYEFFEKQNSMFLNYVRNVTINKFIETSFITLLIPDMCLLFPEIIFTSEEIKNYCSTHPEKENIEQLFEEATRNLSTDQLKKVIKFIEDTDI